MEDIWGGEGTTYLEGTKYCIVHCLTYIPLYSTNKETWGGGGTTQPAASEYSIMHCHTYHSLINSSLDFALDVLLRATGLRFAVQLYNCQFPMALMADNMDIYFSGLSLVLDYRKHVSQIGLSVATANQHEASISI